MRHITIIAATLLALGTTAAFAGDGDVNAQPPPVHQTQSAAQAAGQQRLFPSSTREHRNVYGLFNGGSFPDGGEN